MSHFSDFIFGSAKFKIVEKENFDIFNKLQSVGVYSLEKTKNAITFKCRLTKISDIKKILNEFEFEYVYETYGILTLIPKYKRNSGIFAGILITLLLDSVFSGLIWTVEVNTESDMNTQEIKNNLELLGVYEGARKRDIDVKKLYIDYMLKDKNVSWVHLNMTGTTASFEVSKRELPNKSNPDKIEISNIIASCDGIIDRMDIYSGGREVENGESVTKGQLLISSFFETRMSGYILRRAKGTVIAYTEPVFEMMIPKQASEYTKKNVIKRRGVNFLSNYFIFKTPLKKIDAVYSYPSYTKSTRELFGFLRTPFILCIDSFTEVEQSSKIQSYDECNDIYQLKLRDKIQDISKRCEIINFETTYSESEEYYVFKTRFSCKESIGCEKTISVNENNLYNT